MKVKFVYKVLPVLLIKAPWLVPKRFDAMNYGLFVAFKEAIKYKSSAYAPLVQHELEHTKQFFKLPILHPLLYALSKQYRYKSELDAYVKQLQCYSEDDQLILIPRICDILYKNYNLNSYKDYFEITTDLVNRLGLNKHD